MIIIFLSDPLKNAFYFLKQMAILIYRVSCHSYHLSRLPPKIKKSYSNVTKESYSVCLSSHVSSENSIMEDHLASLGLKVDCHKISCGHCLHYVFDGSS